MTDDKFQAFVQNEANNLWSKAVRIERLEYEGRQHYKLSTQLLWFKSRIYGKFILLQLNKAVFQKTQFLQAYHLNHDEKEELPTGDLVFYKYLLVEQQNHWSEQACRDKKPSYKPQDIEKMLVESNPLLFKFLQCKFDGWQHNICMLPPNNKRMIDVQDVVKAAEKQNVKPEEYTVEEFVGDGDTIPINNHDLQSLLKFKGRIKNKLCYSHRTILKFYETVFIVEFMVVYYIKEEYRKEERNIRGDNEVKYLIHEHIFQQGKSFTALFLLGSQERTFQMHGLEDKCALLTNKLERIGEVLQDIFSLSLPRSRNLYIDTPRSDLDKLFVQIKVKDQDVEWVQANLKVGDILYVDRKVYYHVGVYLGGDLLIHVSMDHFDKWQGLTENDKSSLRGKLFSFDNFTHFINKDGMKYDMVVRRLWFCPFTKKDIIEQSLKVKQTIVNYDPHSENCEHLSMKLMTGRNYSSQAGLLSMLVQPLVKTGLYKLSIDERM